MALSAVSTQKRLSFEVGEPQHKTVNKNRIRESQARLKLVQASTICKHCRCTEKKHYTTL